MLGNADSAGTVLSRYRTGVSAEIAYKLKGFDSQPTGLREVHEKPDPHTIKSYCALGTVRSSLWRWWARSAKSAAGKSVSSGSVIMVVWMLGLRGVGELHEWR